MRRHGWEKHYEACIHHPKQWLMQKVNAITPNTSLAQVRQTEAWNVNLWPDLAQNFAYGDRCYHRKKQKSKRRQRPYKVA
jgi:hypothetical protein